MALNPFFLQGSQSEQYLIQDLINEQLRIYGIEVYYLPRKIFTTDNIIREIQSSKFDDTFLIEAYLTNYEGYAPGSDIMTKFGLSLKNEISITISRERYEEFVAPFLEGISSGVREGRITGFDFADLITRPKEGDLIYFPLGERLFEIKRVESEKPFYQLGKNYVYELNYASAQVARKAADDYSLRTPDKPRFVAGSVGPTNKTASMSPDVNDPGYRAITFDQLVEAYSLQINALIEGGVDLILIETIFDTLNAKAALFATQEVQEALGSKIPVMVSGTITDASGRTLSGQTVEAFLISLQHAELLSIGLNCALGADQLLSYIRRLAQNADCYISAHPNAGLPNAFGQYDQDAEAMGALIKKYLDESLVNIIGGCCGSTPEHIKVIAELVKDYTPRALKSPAL